MPRIFDRHVHSDSDMNEFRTLVKTSNVSILFRSSFERKIADEPKMQKNNTGFKPGVDVTV